MLNTVLILGSAPDAVHSRLWPREVFSSIVAINNAWRVREDWDYLVHADDFPDERLPSTIPRSSTIVSSTEFVPAQNWFGGFVYAGGTMAFTASYWALKFLRPDILAFAGCDMIYAPDGPTHFYGKGSPDPLRDDVTLRNLEAKSCRLFQYALREGTLCLNLSLLPESRLAIPRCSLGLLQKMTVRRLEAIKTVFRAATDRASVKRAEALESQLAYFVESGRYWEKITDFDAAKLGEIDDLWLSSTIRLPRSVDPSRGCWRREVMSQAA